MSKQGHTPVEVLSLLEFQNYDLVVRCLELVRLHIRDFAPQCNAWDVRVIALCHHHPDNIYPAFGVFDAGDADFEEVESFGQQANEWVQKQPFGWLLEASAAVEATLWDTLRAEGSPEPA